MAYPFANTSNISRHLLFIIQVRVPAFDLVPPDLIDLYVTNNGSHQPSYMYRLLAEYYHPNDHVL
jgi:translation initiation factor eIF-2B subunit beta